MTFLQKLILAFMSKSRAKEAQAESESWLLHCPNCGTARSVWEMGGIRYKAASQGRTILARCRQCGQKHNMRLERKDAN